MNLQSHYNYYKNFGVKYERAVSAYIDNWSCDIKCIRGMYVVGVYEWVESDGSYSRPVHLESINDVPSGDYASTFLKNWVKSKKREWKINKILGK